MNTTKIKNKVINYSENLTDNVYTINFNYIKPASAQWEKRSMVYEFKAYITGDVDGYTNLPTLNLAATLNGKSLSIRGEINRYDSKYINSYLADYHYNSSVLAICTKADAEVYSEIIKEITSNSSIITLDIITDLCSAKNKVNRLQKAASNLIETSKELKAAQWAYDCTLSELNLTEEEAEAAVQLLNEGAEYTTVLAMVKRLLAV